MSEIDGKGKKGDALSFLRAGRAESMLIGTLTAAITVARLHEISNVAVKDALFKLFDSLTTFLLLRERAVILVTQKRIYVNGRLVRHQQVGGRMDEYLSFMDRFNMGGIVFSGRWGPDSVREFLRLISRVDKEVPRPQRVRELRAGMDAIPHAELVALDPAQAEIFVKEEEEGYVSPKERAAYYYARLVALIEASHAALQTGRGPDVHSRHLRQTIMRVIDHIADPQFRERLIGLTALPQPDENPLPYHVTNVAILTLSMGRLLGLQSGGLADLMFAALHHDLGRAGHMHEIGADGMSEDRAQAEMHIVRGMQYCLRARNYGSTGLFRIVVSQEHHRASDDYPESSALRAPHLFSQMVNVADAFDRLQNGLPWAPSVQPKQALEILESDGDRYPSAVVELLRDVIGRYPRGTTLRLWDGAVGVVLAGGAERGHRPIVRRLLGADQTPDEQQTLLELPTPDQHAEVVDADEFMIDWRNAVVD